MYWLLPFNFILFFLILPAIAAPTLSDTPTIIDVVSTSSLTSSTTPISTTPTARSSEPVALSSTRRQPPISKTRRPASAQHSGTAPHPQPTHIIPPGPPRSPSPSNPNKPFHHRTGPSPVVIFFEVLGGIAGLAFTLSIMRCLYSYKKTPAQDRIAALLSRHQLQRELEELERQGPRRGSLQRPPPPPYIPPPPSYEDSSSHASNSGSATPITDPQPPPPQQQQQSLPPPNG